MSKKKNHFKSDWIRVKAHRRLIYALLGRGNFPLLIKLAPLTMSERNYKRMSSTTVKKLRCATYMCPSFPVEYFEAIVHYLESKLKLNTCLVYESRWEGPPPNRPDPFNSNDIDLAFVTCTAYLQYLDNKNASAELLPVSSIHSHCRGENKPGYFCDVIAQNGCKDRVKEFLDLRGCKWAVNNTTSLSGNIIPLIMLKQLGENAAIFGHVIHTGTHLKSIEMVINKKVDAAAVDANCLATYLDHRPEHKSEFITVTSWGPLPPYPILINTRLPDEMKLHIKEALLSIHQDAVWGPRLRQFHVLKFSEISPDSYNKLHEILQNAASCTLNTVYY